MKYNQSILKNGLTVISAQISDLPVANISIWFKAGYGYESDNECGYTHLFEHLLFCGTERRPDNYAVNIEKDRIGAYSNGSTSRDQLYFVIQSGLNYANQMLDLLSDIILNSSLKDEAIENEKMTVMHELRKIQGDRMGSAARIELENFFNKHPLGKHILLSGETVQKATRDELYNFYKNFCLPNKAAVIVSSSLPHEEVVALCEKYFSSWSIEEVVELQTNIDKPIANQKTHFFKEDSGSQSILSINFYTGGVNEIKENAALALVASYLGYGFTGLLSGELRVNKGLIYSLNCYNLPYEKIGRFNIATQTNKPQEVFDIIKQRINELPSHFNRENLDGLKTQYINAFLRETSDPMKILEFLGRGFAINDPIKSPNEHIEYIKSVSYEDIINAVEKYLTPSNMFVFIQGPKDITLEA